jgi:hypothetical protein
LLCRDSDMIQILGGLATDSRNSLLIWLIPSYHTLIVNGTHLTLSSWKSDQRKQGLNLIVVIWCYLTHTSFPCLWTSYPIRETGSCSKKKLSHPPAWPTQEKIETGPADWKIRSYFSTTHCNSKNSVKISLLNQNAYFVSFIGNWRLPITLYLDVHCSC